jgi:hypothetical protein
LQRRRPFGQHDPDTPPWCEQHPRCWSRLGDVAAVDGESTTSKAHAVRTAAIDRSMGTPPVIQVTTLPGIWGGATR